MGMSASQARLLTITGRLTDNELRSQTITNSKLRLAQKSSEASQEYMDALSSEKFVFNYFNNNGEKSTYNLTPALLYSYEPLKNQYSIQNASGQYIVSATDANNFETSDTLSEFLEKYGLTQDTTDADKFKDDMKEYNKNYAKYEEDLGAYNKEKEKYEKDLGAYNKEKEKYEKDLKDYYEKLAIYDKEYAKWSEAQKQPDVYAIFSGGVGTSKDPVAYCYDEALKGNAGCYLHLLNEILDFNGTSLENHTYTTTIGDEVTTNAATGAMWNKCNDAMKQTSDAMNQKDENGDYVKLCDGSDDLSSNEKVNILEIAKNEGRKPSKLERLKSDYVENADGTYSLKSLKQKAIDLYYIIQNMGEFSENGGITQEVMKEMLINFTDGDMKKLTTPKPEMTTPKPEMTTPKPEMTTSKPEKPQKPSEPTYDLAVTDKEKAQWYVNLWYMMSDSESANKLDDNVNTKGETIYTTKDVLKSNNSSKNYKVIDDQLLTSNDWLTFALKNGVVTLKQASYFNPAVDSSKKAEMTSEGYFWNSIAYSSTSDLVSVEDEIAIAKAEVKYKNTTTEIENQDKKYDQDLKKLDSEHNALQTEYESLKGVIDKNVERSFKAFS